MIEEWQTAALYGALAVLVGFLFWRWHTDPIYKNFSLIHAVSNREGFYDPDRAHLTGAFLVTTFGVVASVIRGTATNELLIGYALLWGAKAAWNYTISKRSDVDIKREEIKRGRLTDIEPTATVQDETQQKERRRKKLLE